MANDDTVFQRNLDIDNKKNYEEKQQAKSRVIQFRKKVRRSDKIGGKIWALFMIFTSIIAIARLTVVGQFLDDVFLTFFFGWFKYVIYFVILSFSFCIFLGMQIKIKTRAKLMIICFILITCWFVNDIVLLINKQAAMNIKGDWFTTVISNYLRNWQEHSIFVGKLDIKKFFLINGSYFTPIAGGGFLGMLFSGIFGYGTTFTSLGLAFFFLVAFVLWMLSGNPLYIFQWKSKRNQKGIKIVSLSDSHKNPKKNRKNKKYEPYFENINFQGIKIDDRQVLHSSRESDVTIKLPSFAFKELLEDENLLFDDIYENRKKKTVNPEWQPRNTPNINVDEQNIKDIPYRSEDKYLRKEQTSLLDINTIRESFNEGTYVTPFNRSRTDIKPASQQQRQQAYSKTTSIELTNENLLKEVLVGDENFKTTPAVVINEQVEPLFTNEIDLVVKKPELSLTPSNYFPSIINPNYQLPPLSLLNKPTISANKELNIKTATENVKKIHRLFHQFHIDAKVTNINIGPTVTKFEIEPGMGVKVSKITTLENDIKLALASKEIRLEAPIHGKSAVGIEIPNISPALVTLREIMEHIPENKVASKLLMAIGKNVMGKIIFAELDKMPHLLIAGATGSGKSICINSIIASLILRAKPHEIKFLLIDPKRVELSVYNELPHLLVPVITDLKKANRALKQIISEMERRYVIFSNLGVRNIAAYNNQVSFEEQLPFIIIIIDELADLMVVAGKEVEESIMRITQMARASGIHLIIATQRPSTDIITGVIKSNIPSRIAFAVSSAIDSRTILDSMGAERLIGSGDMLFSPYGQITPTRAQGVFIGDEEINALIKFITKQQKSHFSEEIVTKTQASSYTSHIITGEDDELYEEIRDFVISHQRASASLLQRRFGIGYNRAARMVDSLEANGVIGQQNGSKPREVLIKKE